MRTHLLQTGTLLVLAACLFLACDLNPLSFLNAVPTPVGGGTGKIAFVSARDGGSEIYIMNAGGSQQVRLTNNPGGIIFPRGRRMGCTLLSLPTATATGKSM